MSKFGNKFSNLSCTNHLRLVESSLEAEFNYLLNRRKFFQNFQYFWDLGASLDISLKMHLFAWNSAQNNHIRLVECSLEAKFNYLHDKRKYCQKFQYFGDLGPNFYIWKFPSKILSQL